MIEQIVVISKFTKFSYQIYENEFQSNFCNTLLTMRAKMLATRAKLLAIKNIFLSPKVLYCPKKAKKPKTFYLIVP